MANNSHSSIVSRAEGWEDSDMSQAIRLRIPEDWAEDLVQEGTAIESFVTRGSLSDFVQIAVAAVSTTADFATVAVAIATLPKAVNSMLRLIRPSQDDLATYTVNGPAGTEKVYIAKGESEHIFVANGVEAILRVMGEAGD